MAQPHSGQIKAETGFITLLTVIIISLVTLAITFTNLLLSISAVQTSKTNELSFKAVSVADGCVYDGLNRIRLDSTYTGTQVLTIGEGSCTEVVSNIAAGQKQIDSTAIINDVTRKIQVKTSQVNPQIIIASWQEIP
jgi:hypothetical protein